MSSNRRLNTSDYIDSPGASASDITGTTFTDSDSGRDKRAMDVYIANAAQAFAWQKYEVVIPASSTQVVDINLLTSFSRINYILNFKMEEPGGVQVMADNTVVEDTINRYGINASNNWYAQTFTPDVTANIGSMRWYFYKQLAPTGNLVLEIRDRVGANPGPNVLATSDPIDASTIATSPGGDYVFTFSGLNQIELSNAGNYAAVLNSSAMSFASGSNRINVIYDPAQGYLNGGGYYSTNGGGSWTPWFDASFTINSVSGDSIFTTKGLELAVQNNNGELTDSVSVRLGGVLDVLTNVTDDLVDMNLEIVNNESNDVVLTFLKSIL